MEKKYAKLRGRIVERKGTQALFAEAMGLSAATISRKLGGYTDWTRQEIERAQVILDIPADELPSYFF